jgi:hypothetical protein
MAIELTTDQARYIARMRRVWPGAEVLVHQRCWGVIVEVRLYGRAVSLVGFDGEGGILFDEPLRLAA